MQTKGFDLFEKYDIIVNMKKIITEKERILSDKLIMLFVIAKIEISLTEDSILDICSIKNEWIKNYMDCKAIIHELVESKLLYKISDENDSKELFDLTYEGRECLSNLYRLIPIEKRNEISSYLQANKLSVKSSQEYSSTYRKNLDGSYNVEFKIYEPQSTSPMFVLTIKAPTRQSAIEASHKWKTTAPTIYETIFEKLINID